MSIERSKGKGLARDAEQRRSLLDARVLIRMRYDDATTDVGRSKIVGDGPRSCSTATGETRPGLAPSPAMSTCAGSGSQSSPHARGRVTPGETPSKPGSGPIAGFSEPFKYEETWRKHEMYKMSSKAVRGMDGARNHGSGV